MATVDAAIEFCRTMHKKGKKAASSKDKFESEWIKVHEQHGGELFRFLEHSTDEALEETRGVATSKVKKGGRARQ